MAELNAANVQRNQLRTAEILMRAVEEDNLEIVTWFFDNNFARTALDFRSILTAAIQHNKPRICQLVYDRAP